MNNRRLIYFLLFATAAITFSGLGYAQTSTDGGGSYAVANDPHATLGRPGSDEGFIERGLQDANAAVILSKLALSKSNNSDVKSLAQKVVDKHIAMGGPLVQDAKAFKIQIPKGLSGPYPQQYANLTELSGDAFDKAYLAALLKLQHDDYANMLDESKSTLVPHIQDETGKDMPTLALLDSEAEKLSKKLNGKK